MDALTLTRRISGISVLLLLAVPVQAQLGALRRAAGKAVEQKVEDRSQVAMLIEPTFDATTIEITPERLDRYSAAMQALKAQRAARQQRYDQMQTQINALNDSARALDNERERNTFERNSTTYSECRSSVQKAADATVERKQEEMIARMQRDPIGAQNDPKLKEMMTVIQARDRRGDRQRVARSGSRDEVWRPTAEASQYGAQGGA
jgi:hypothetical protein